MTPTPDTGPPSFEALAVRQITDTLQVRAIALCRTEALRSKFNPEDLIDLLALSLTRRAIERRLDQWTHKRTPTSSAT